MGFGNSSIFGKLVFFSTPVLRIRYHDGSFWE